MTVVIRQQIIIIYSALSHAHTLLSPNKKSTLLQTTTHTHVKALTYRLSAEAQYDVQQEVHVTASTEAHDSVLQCSSIKSPELSHEHRKILPLPVRFFFLHIIL